MKIDVFPVQAYLENARGFLSAPIIGTSQALNDESHLPGTFIFAFLSQAYIFSFMAIQAFLAERLWSLWNANDKPLQNKFPNAKSFDHLMNSDLKEIKEQIKVAAEIHGIPQIRIQDAVLWEEFLQVVKVTRDFLVHPSPEPEKMNNIIGHVFTKRDWKFPSEVASKILLHFMKNTGSPVPPWVMHNELISIPSVTVLNKTA